MSETKAVKFFLGANSPQGFYSLFEQIENPKSNWHTFLIKGGPGCGKSTFMKKIAKNFSENCSNLEEIPCSSDPNSLDAVIIPEKQTSIMDATSPHAQDAKIPNLRQTILSFGDFINRDKLLKNRSEIESLFSSTPEYYKLAVSYLFAAQAFLRNSYNIAENAIDKEKIYSYAKRFAQKNFKSKNSQTNNISLEKKRFLTTICSEGLVALEDTAQKLCRKIYLIEDDFGAVANCLLSAIRFYALEANLEIITCFCPMEPERKIEHLFIPSLGIAFLTSNHFHPMKNSSANRKIHARRFQNQEFMTVKKNRFSYNRKAAQTLINEAVEILRESKKLHDVLELRYQEAMDFDALNKKFENFNL